MAETSWGTDEAGVPPAQELMRLARGYMASQIVGAAARLGLAEQLQDGPRKVTALARAMGADEDALLRFLRAAVSVGLARPQGTDSFAKTPMLELLLPGDRSLRSFVLSFTGPGLYRPLEEMHNVVKDGRSHTADVLGGDLWAYYKEHDDESTWFADTMGEQSEFAADVVLPRHDFTGGKKVVDVGGSHGVLLSRVLENTPDATGVVFDLPEVVSRARDYVQRRGLTDRVEFAGGSFLEEIPSGGDVYLLKSILCDWDDESCVKILSNIHRASAPGTPLIVLDWLLPEEPDWFLDVTNIGLLAYTNGRVRNEEQYRALFEKAGYDLKRIETATDSWLRVTVFEAVRP